MSPKYRHTKCDLRPQRKRVGGPDRTARTADDSRSFSVMRNSVTHFALCTNCNQGDALAKRDRHVASNSTGVARCMHRRVGCSGRQYVALVPELSTWTCCAAPRANASAVAGAPAGIWTLGALVDPEQVPRHDPSPFERHPRPAGRPTTGPPARRRSTRRPAVPRSVADQSVRARSSRRPAAACRRTTSSPGRPARSGRCAR